MDGWMDGWMGWDGMGWDVDVFIEGAGGRETHKEPPLPTVLYQKTGTKYVCMYQ